MYEEAIKMYYDQIKLKNGQDCDEEGLIILILLIVMGEIKRAHNEMF